MSGSNTKDSKINRVLTRQVAINDELANLFRLMRDVYTENAMSKFRDEAIERLSNSLKIAVETADRLEAENDKLRKYLGGELFARRQREMQIPTLEPRFGNRSLCTCVPGQCKGDPSICWRALSNAPR